VGDNDYSGNPQYVLIRGYSAPPITRSFTHMLRSMDALYEDVVWADENSSCDSELDLSSCFLTQAEVSVNVSIAVVYVKILWHCYPMYKTQVWCYRQPLVHGVLLPNTGCMGSRKWVKIGIA